MEQVRDIKAIDHTRKGIYKVGGVAALIAVFLFRRNIGSEVNLFRILGLIDFTPPVTATEWFTLS